MLAYHPDDARVGNDVALLSCPLEDALQIAVAAACGSNVEVFSPSIGRQLLRRDLVDQIDLHIVPVLLGDGVRLFDNARGQPIRLTEVNRDVPSAAHVRHRPAL